MGLSTNGTTTSITCFSSWMVFLVEWGWDWWQALPLNPIPWAVGGVPGQGEGWDGFAKGWDPGGNFHHYPGQPITCLH